MSGARVLVIGMGGLGPWLLERLVHSPAVGALIAADADRDRLAGAAGCAQLGLALEQLPAKLTSLPLDLTDVEATARVLDAARPDVIVQGASLLPVDRWWSIAAEPGAGPALQAAGLGPWLPLQLLLPLRLMEAVRQAGCDATVLNLSYPDAVNAVLARVGHAAPLGTGNISLLAAAVRHAAAERCELPVERVSVSLSTHYAHLRWAMGGGRRPSEHGVLRVEADGRDVTARLDPYELLEQGGKRIPWGTRSHPLTAAAVARHVELLAREEPVAAHMAGACGEPGGYPVRIGRAGVELDPPPGYDVAQLVEMQERAQRDDGIQRIADDGTVTLTDEAAEQMRRLFGWRHAELTPDAVPARARELLAALRDFPTNQVHVPAPGTQSSHPRGER